MVSTAILYNLCNNLELHLSMQMSVTLARCSPLLQIYAHAPSQLLFGIAPPPPYIEISFPFIVNLMDFCTVILSDLPCCIWDSYFVFKVSYENDPQAALIQFSNNAEARKAYSSPEAVLGNRFIKIFWHNKTKELPPMVRPTTTFIVL